MSVGAPKRSLLKLIGIKFQLITRSAFLITDEKTSALGIEAAKTAKRMYLNLCLWYLGEYSFLKRLGARGICNVTDANSARGQTVYPFVWYALIVGVLIALCSPLHLCLVSSFPSSLAFPTMQIPAIPTSFATIGETLPLFARVRSE